MGRRKHPVTQRIEKAIDKLEAHSMEVTPATVKVNAEKEITWADWSAEQAASEALDVRIARCLRARGYVIADAVTGVRKDFWNATTSELAEQLQVKEKSSDYDLTRIKADVAVLTFLREKEKEMGYEVYPGLFQGEIERIYSMHGIAAPA